MCQVCEEIAQESLKVRRITTEEAAANPDVFVQRVQERIDELLEKYQCMFEIKAFTWNGGIAEAQIEVVRKPQEDILNG